MEGWRSETSHLSAASGDTQCGRSTWNLEAVGSTRGTGCGGGRAHDAGRLVSRRMNGLLWIDGGAVGILCIPSGWRHLPRTVERGLRVRRSSNPGKERSQTTSSR